MNETAGPKSSALPCGFIVMRHGRREDTDNPLWQVQARFPFDTPLSASGKEIMEAANRLKQAGRTIDVVYTSPFLRCLQTSEQLIRALGCENIPVFVHQGLSEVHSPHLLFKASRPSLSQRARYWLWRASYSSHSRPARQRFTRKARILDGSWPQVPESEYSATLRFRQVILELAAKHPGQQVLLVSHGKSVQVAHEALGCPQRVQQVGFAGFIACRPKSEQPQGQQQQGQGQDQQRPTEAGEQRQERAGEQGGDRTSGGVQWGDFGLDPQVPSFGVEFYT
ncbi:hypothetical protein PLESTB_001255200 [Pleodorina starrii]|uniref:Histidine phosphatase family protein n=1 Tax=Pleodorina starrii TaxID=330485 RepID=A0A9W6BTJ1_9CHLO|nr:hypothetical protein PLESTM_000204800 [Pleodorina starrii]GLC57700.1 hypothetical protein PLESTB_001255200 [Pleodorina starrii]GLC63369.1 hypothetical protein PLESTF_000029000 [Pleodorina starrii]